ncbi:M20 family metallopeptidase [Arthrobacter sp. SIMBA_036]|uniref:M20 family metallopeptidase n=2 Tax=Bacteria TaxID=2 RepID=UPI00397DC31C
MANSLLDALSQLQHRMVVDLELLVSAESPSAHPVELGSAAYVVAHVGRGLLGCEPVYLPGEGCDHLLWTMGDRPKVLVVGHYDTVWPPGTTARWPFSVDGDKATGPGSFDMKAGLVQAFYAVQALGRPDGVQILITGDEEIGSPSSRSWIEKLAAGAEAVLVLEASLDGALKTSRKGASTYRLHARGRASHAGLEPDAGVNATLEIAQQILSIEKLADAPAGTSVTPTTLRSGDASNQIPASSWLDIDVRAASMDELERVDCALRSLRPQLDGASLKIEGGIDRGPLAQARASALFDRANEVAQFLGLPPLRQAMAGGTSDGNLTAALGIPTLDGLGAVGAGAHCEGEWAQVSAMPERAALLAGLIDSLLRSPVESPSTS